MSPDFSRLVDPIFEHVLDVLRKHEEGASVDVHRERNAIRNMLNNSEREVGVPIPELNRPLHVSKQDFQQAKRVLVYWVDEVMTEVNSTWKDNTLEREYYVEKDRAWKFYVCGEQEWRSSSADVVEIYYLAIVLGFVGDIADAFQYHMKRDLPGRAKDDEAARIFWARELQQSIMNSTPETPAGRPLTGTVAPLKGRGLFTISLIAILVVSILWTLAGFVLVFSKSAEDDPDTTTALPAVVDVTVA